MERMGRVMLEEGSPRLKTEICRNFSGSGRMLVSRIDKIQLLSLFFIKVILTYHTMIVQSTPDCWIFTVWLFL